jgi:hypothetical protein
MRAKYEKGSGILRKWNENERAFSDGNENGRGRKPKI